MRVTSRLPNSEATKRILESQRATIPGKEVCVTNPQDPYGYNPFSYDPLGRAPFESPPVQPPVLVAPPVPYPPPVNPLATLSLVFAVCVRAGRGDFGTPWARANTSDR